MGKLRGFTLIEIVLVIALIGVTASVVISLVNPVQQFKKANDAKRKADLAQLQAAFELYRADQDMYPDTLPSCGSALTGVTATYLQKIPCDPRNTGQFVYNYERLTFNTYQLIACLENTTDLNKDDTNNGTYCAGDDTNWSYTVTNP